MANDARQSMSMPMNIHVYIGGGRILVVAPKVNAMKLRVACTAAARKLGANSKQVIVK